MKRLIKSNVFKFSVLFIPVGILFFVYNFLTPLYGDDYSYMYSFTGNGQRISSILDIFPSMYSHYFSMNGRLVTHFLAQLFLLIGKNIFNIINTFAFLFLGVLICVHATRSIKKIKVFYLIFIYASLFLFAPAFGQSFLWITGASNYLYGPLILLLFLLPYRFSYDGSYSSSFLSGLLKTLAMFIFGLIAGNTNENTVLAVLCVLVLYFIYRYIKYKNIQLWAISGFIGLLISCIFMLISPGSYKRLGEANLFDIPAILKSSALSTFNLLEKCSFLIILLFILFAVYFIWFRNNYACTGKSYLKSCKFFMGEMDLFIVYIFLFVVSFYSISATRSFPGRAWSGILMFLIISIVILYDKCTNIISGKIYFESIVAIALILVSVGTYCNNFFEMKFVYTEYQNRIATIEVSKDNGGKSVETPSISSKSKYSCYYGAGDLSDDKTSWQNTGIARYFEVDNIVKNGTATLD